MPTPDRVTISHADIDDAMEDAEDLIRERLPAIEQLQMLPSEPRTQILRDGWLFVGLIVAYLVEHEPLSFAVRINALTGERRLSREWD